jgi:agmatine/peptidylarginine deiminase
MLSTESSASSGCDTVNQSNSEKTLIVLSAVSIHSTTYAPKNDDIIDYMINFANEVNGKDDVVILVDADTLPLFEGKVPCNTLIKADIADIWIRDYSSVIPSKQVKFKFAPSYRTDEQAKLYESSFNDWFKKTGLQYHATSDIILDGGNVVDNVAGTRVVVTDRILHDNHSLTKSDAKHQLKNLLGVQEVAIIPQTPGDTTGHADGCVMWPMDDTIVLIKSDDPEDPYDREVVHELKHSFPGVKIVGVPNYIPDTLWHGFSSAVNCFVNSIVTDRYIYMPTFNDGHDDETLELFKSITNKTVVPIPAGNVAEMGGSVRCLSWQVKGENRMKILELVE